MQAGEGVIGLTRAFMYAGTPAVSVTLWSVESQSSKMLSTGHYENLNSGKTRARALRDIKVRMIRGQRGRTVRAPLLLGADGNFWGGAVILGKSLCQDHEFWHPDKVRGKLRRIGEIVNLFRVFSHRQSPIQHPLDTGETGSPHSGKYVKRVRLSGRFARLGFPVILV